MRFNKYTKEDFIDAVQTSFSIRQVLIKLGVKPYGGNYHVAHTYIKKLGLDTDHFKGQGWNKGKNFGPKRPIEDYLSNKFPIQSHKLKLRLFKEKYFEKQCNKCKRTKWNGGQIPLELEHKDGNHKNNNLENLEILCPNCHAQTLTYRGKNKK